MEAPVAAGDVAATRIDDVKQTIKDLNNNIKEYHRWIREEECWGAPGRIDSGLAGDDQGVAAARCCSNSSNGT